MAYVESFYLEPENQVPVFTETMESRKIASQPQLNEPETEVVIPNVKNYPPSDYCGFESDEIPPVYRAQLRAAQKLKILEAENAGKSVYAYATDGADNKPVNMNHGVMMEEKKMASNVPQSVEYYVPGFSPPPKSDNEEVQKRADFSLPKIQPIEATENVFKVAGKHEASQYIPVENECSIQLNTCKHPQTESLISYTASGATSFINTDSCITATLGPAYGYLPSVSVHAPEEKYKGLSAFRPITKSLSSHYALAELN